MRINQLTFKIQFSKVSEEHEVKIYIDGKDWWEKECGVDPPKFFGQDFEKTEGFLLVGICGGCGVEGCANTWVEVKSQNGFIEWWDKEEKIGNFDKSTYLQSIRHSANDHSWEDIHRRVERLVGKIFKEHEPPNGYVFNWASCRVEKNTVLLGFSKQGEQKLLRIKWDEKAEQDVIAKAQQLQQEYRL